MASFLADWMKVCKFVYAKAKSIPLDFEINFFDKFD